MRSSLKSQKKNYHHFFINFPIYVNAYRALRLYVKEESNVNNNPELYAFYQNRLIELAKQISTDFFTLKSDFIDGLLTMEDYAHYLKFYREFLFQPGFYNIQEINKRYIADEIEAYL